jgi:hypothetical protein
MYMSFRYIGAITNKVKLQDDRNSDNRIKKRERGFWNSFLGKFQCYGPVYRGVP